MTPRVMYDGTGNQSRDPQAIAAKFGTSNLVAGYTDGLYAWTAAQWAPFPEANRITISAIPGSATAKDAMVADCESGDYTPEQAAAWLHEVGQRRTVYCSLSEIPAVRAATGALVLGTDYDIWCADWTGTAHEVTAPGPGAAVNCAAVQWNHDIDGGIADVSAVYDDAWPHTGAAGHQPGHLYWHTLAKATTVAELAASRGYPSALSFIQHEQQLQAVNTERLIAAAVLQPGEQWVSVNP